MTDKKNSNLITAGLAFSIIMLTTLLFGYKVQSREIYSGLLITEFILILIPCIVVALVAKLDFKSTFRLNSTGPLNLFLSFVIALMAIPALAPLNIIFAILEKLIFGKIITPEMPAPKSGTELIIAILVIGGSAGICEELLFRGIIQKGLERFGGIRALIFTSLLFGFFHIYIQKFPPTFLLGLVLGYVAYITRSIFNTMLMHFTNNALAVLISMVSGFLPKMNNSGQSADSAINEILKMPTPQLFASLFVYVIVFLVFGSALGGIMYALYAVNKNKNKIASLTVSQGELENNELGESKPVVKETKKHLLAFLPGMFIVLLYYTNELLIVYGSDIRLLRTLLGFLNLR